MKDNQIGKHILVGKRVKHKFEQVENGKEVCKWYTGKVISQVFVHLPK